MYTTLSTPAPVCKVKCTSADKLRVKPPSMIANSFPALIDELTYRKICAVELLGEVRRSDNPTTYCTIRILLTSEYNSARSATLMCAARGSAQRPNLVRLYE